MTLTTAQTAGTAVQLFVNDDEPIRDRTVVDGFVTIVCTTTVLHTVRLFAPAPGFAVAGDFTFGVPSRREFISWYSFGCASGPLVYRLRSKRTIAFNEEIWAQVQQERGGASTVVRVYWEMLLSPG